MTAHRAPIDSARGPLIVVDGRELVSFAGCDSLGLARHPDVIGAAQEALGRCGVSASASRTTTGTWTEHVRLEAALAAYLGVDDAVVLPSGWLACPAAVRAAAANARGVVVDAGAHPAVREAAARAGPAVTTYARHDPDDARRRLDALVGGRPVAVTCTIDLVGSAIAPLAGLHAAVSDVAGTLVVDDAHGVGVLGARGRGAAEHAGILGDGVVVSGSLAKALGAQGGFVAGTSEMCARVRADDPAWSATTPLAPALAAAARRAIELASDDALRTRLGEVCRAARAGFGRLGLAVPDEPVPWMSVRAEHADRLRELEHRCRNAGLLVPYVSYHGAPPEGYVRVALSAAHEDAHVAALLDVLGAWV